MGECCSKQVPNNQKIEIDTFQTKKIDKKEVIQIYEQKIRELEFQIQQQNEKLLQVGSKDKLYLTKQIQILDKRNQDLLIELNNIKLDIKTGSNMEISTTGFDIYGNDTLIGRIGGSQKVIQIVNDVYDIALKNGKINHFFKNTNMDNQRKQLAIFLIEAFGGSKNYIGKDMVQAHDNLGIQNIHFDEMAQILQKVLQNHNINQKEYKEITKIWESQRLFITSNQNQKNKSFSTTTPFPNQKSMNNLAVSQQRGQSIILDVGNIYEKIGSHKIEKAVELTFQQVYKHPELKVYFKNILMDKQISHVKDFMIRALGGPNTYKGRDMKTVHSQLKIQPKHFIEFLKMLKQNLSDQNVDQNITNAIEQLLLPLQKEIAIQEEDNNIINKLGGRESLFMAIDELYDKVYEEPSLARFFKNTKMQHQKNEMVNYLMAKLSGKQNYQHGLKNLKEIHDGIFVSEDDFDLFVKLFSKTLHELKIGKAMHDDILMVLAGVKYEICMPKLPLFDRIGGSKKIEKLVTEFYAKVLNDKSLQPFFANISMAKQKKMFRHFFTQALGGNDKYDGQTLKDSHMNLNIQDEHFDKIAEIMFQTFKEFDIEQDLINEVETILETIRYEIVNSKTYFAQIGGKIVLKQIINEYYEQLLNDFKIRRYFNQVNLEAVKNHQVNYIQQLLGGQNKYTGRNIIKIHENMGISDIEFNKAMEYLQNAFLKYNISEDLTKKCMEIIQNTGEKIVEKKIKQKQEELKKQQQQEELKQQQKQRPSQLQNKPLIVRLGGVPSIDILTEQFFDRVMDDETLGKYFRNLDLEKQKKQLTLFLVQIFGGEVRYRGKDMKMAHNNLKITEELYNKFVDTLIESMEIMKIPTNYQKEAKNQILTTKSDIVNTLTPAVPIIQQIGGPEILKELITRYYKEIYVHDKLKNYFQQISQSRLQFIKQHIFTYLSQELGGSQKYSGVKLEELHKNLKITPEDYTEFCKILIKVMKQMNFTTATIRGIGKIIDTLKPKIAFG